jgi:HSP20 family protein
MGKKKPEKKNLPSLIDDFFPSLKFPEFSKLKMRAPLINIQDKGPMLFVSAELPGVDKKSIKLNIDEGSISIGAKQSKSIEKKGKKSYYSEFTSQSFFRKVSLPAEVKPQTASWKFNNGLLEVEIEKKAGVKALPKPK